MLPGHGAILHRKANKLLPHSKLYVSHFPLWTLSDIIGNHFSLFHTLIGIHIKCSKYSSFKMIVSSLPFTSSPFRILKNISSACTGCYNYTTLDSFDNPIIKLLSSRMELEIKSISWLSLLHTTMFFQTVITTH